MPTAWVGKAEPWRSIVAVQRQVGRCGVGRKEKAPRLGHWWPLQGRSPSKIDQCSDPQWQILPFHVMFEDNVIEGVPSIIQMHKLLQGATTAKTAWSRNRRMLAKPKEKGSEKAGRITCSKRC